MNKVLIVEDEESVRANLVELLEVEGYQVIDAPDGETGVCLARQHLPDLVLCDIMMPRLDGYGVLDTLHQDPATAMLPFVFLTARADRLDMRQGMGLGADDYLTKPFTRKELLEVVSTRIARHQAHVNRAQSKLDDLRSSIALGLPHELRTPLTGILGYAQVLLDVSTRPDPEVVLDIAQNIYSSAERLEELILRYLLYSELEIAARDPSYAGAFLTDYPFAIKRTVVQIATAQARQAGRANDLQVDLPEGRVLVAPHNLEILVRELVRNALKFSEAGTPVCITGCHTDDLYRLSVTDRGRGMTVTQVADVGAYLQFERKRYEQHGSGLGLAIVKRLAELQGGRLVIDSVCGQGTTVSVEMRLGEDGQAH